jgi:hypothetical protein
MRLAMNVELEEETFLSLQVPSSRAKQSERDAQSATCAFKREPRPFAHQHGVMNGQDAIKSFE